MHQARLGAYSADSTPCPKCDDSPTLPDKPHRDEEILRHLYHEHDLTQYALADLLCCSRTTIKTWMKKHEVERDRFQYDIPEAELRELYVGEQMSIEDIADHFGCSYLAARNRLQIHDIEIRGLGETAVDPDDDAYRDPDRLRELYLEERLSKGAIAERCGVSEGTVQHHMDQHDIEARDLSAAQTARRARMDPKPYEDEDELRCLYWEEGLTQREIAEHFNCSQLAIQRQMDKFGIQLRYSGVHGNAYETDRGEYVRSSHERQIANWLHAHDVDYEYEPEVDAVSMCPDFAIGGDIIEYWGMINREDYVERMHEKLRVYRESGIEPVSVFPHHLDDLRAILGQYT